MVHAMDWRSSSPSSSISEYTLDSNSSDDIIAVSPKSGGYDYQFLEEPSEDLKCSVCLSVLRDPHLTSCCGHHFCETCIKPIKSGTDRCPLCQEKGFTSMLNKSLCRAVNELKLHCPNSSKGCEWSGELKSVETHFDSECAYVKVNCCYCNVLVLRTRLETHNTKCPKRPFACEACGLVDAWQTIVNIHQPKCPSWRVPCTNNCGSEIMRKNMKKHLKICPLESVSCEFESAGCSELVCRKDAATHAQENVSQHLSLVVASFNAELAKRDNEIDSLKELVQQQGREIAALKSQQSCNSSFPKIFYMSGFECHISKDRWFSDSFLSHPNGYQLCLSVYPNGTGKGAGTHLSVFGHIMLGENDDDLSWPFLGIIHVCLVAGQHKTFRRKLDFTKKNPLHVAATKRVTSGSMNKVGQGLPQFVALSELEECAGLQFNIESVDIKV